MAVDYTKMEYSNPKAAGKASKKKTEAAEPKDISRERWWKAEAGEPRAQAMLSAALMVKEQQRDRSQMNIQHARLYGNNDLASFSGRDYSMSLVQNATSRVAINVVESSTDTLSSKIAKSKPAPSFQTSGGSWTMQRKARQLSKFMRAVFYETQVYTVAVLQFLMACVFGTGALKIFLNAEGRLEIENAFVDELYVENVDAKYGKPRQLWQRRLISKDVLLDLFGDDPAKVEAIEAAKSPEDSAGENVFNDQIEVWEAWHLRSGKDAKDGCHTIAIEGCELFGEEWELGMFPFAFLKFKPRVLGFWGKGVAEILTGQQVSINRTLRSIEEQLRRKGRGRIFTQIGSKILPSHLTNGIADIIQYLGHPPIVDNANAVAAEDYNWLQTQIKQAFQEVGVSQLSAAMQKPSGLDAQVAIREFTDIESERFALLSQAWDQNFLNIAEICIALVSESKGKGYKARLPNKKYVVEMDWKDIDLKRDDFIMQMFPVSSLPNHPGERYQKLTEMKADGVIDLAEFRRLLDFPDLEASANLGNAVLDDALAVVGYILDDATPHLEMPDQYQNMDVLISVANASLLYAKHHGAEDDRLDMLRQLIDACLAMKSSAMEAAAAPPAGAPAAPGMPAPAGSPMQQSQTVNVPPQPSVPPLIA